MSCSRARGAGQPAVHTPATAATTPATAATPAGEEPTGRGPGRRTKGTRGGGTGAVVPLRLAAWFVTSPVLGDELVTTLTLAPGRVGPDLARAQDRRAGAAGQGAAGGLLALVFVAGGLVS
jgi:hypothetical protein